MNERMQTMEQELLQERAVNASLRPLTSVVPEGTRKTWALDTRGLGKPAVFDGAALKWRDWKVLTMSHTAASHDGLSGLMTLSGGTEEPVLNAVRTRRGAREASKLLSFNLVTTFRATGGQQTWWSTDLVKGYRYGVRCAVALASLVYRWGC